MLIGMVAAEVLIYLALLEPLMREWDFPGEAADPYFRGKYIIMLESVHTTHITAECH